MRLIAPLVLLAGCASAGRGAAERDFARDDLGDIPLTSLELVVVVAGPPRASEGRFDVVGHPAVTLEAALLEGAEEPATRDALEAEVLGALRRRGFEVRALGVPTSSTSSAAAARRAGARPGEPLSSVLARSASDAVLVVRAVPVDRFTLDEGAGTRWDETPLGRVRVVDTRPVAAEGRLLVGQAFLFDRATGLRLWSRQAPSYPADGRLSRQHPLVVSGYVQPEGQAPAPNIVRATLAARAYAPTLLDGFPAPSAGEPRARAALHAVDREQAVAEERFFDEAHLAIDLEASWSQERSSVELSLDEAPLPPLGTGAVTPFGLARLGARVAYVAPGGAYYAATPALVLAPSGFARSYVKDNPRPTDADPHRVLAVTSEGVLGGGISLELGRLFWLLEGLALVPRGGLFAEAWSLSLSPTPFVDGDTRVRVGGVLGVEVWRTLGERLFLRVGADGRLGGDTRGGLLFGGGLSLGAGLLL